MGYNPTFPRFEASAIIALGSATLPCPGEFNPARRFNPEIFLDVKIRTPLLVAQH